MEVLDWGRSDVRTGLGLTSEPLTVLLGNGVDCLSRSGSPRGRRTLNINKLIDTRNWVRSLNSSQEPAPPKPGLLFKYA